MFKCIFIFLGLDKSIAYTTSARIIQVLGAVLNLFLISIFLSKEEQGYYYTFGSIIAIQVFFELGLNSVIIQFASHEVAHLEFDAINLNFKGSTFHLSRLSSLSVMIFKIFSKLGIILFIILNIAGYIFFNNFNQNNLNISWQFPWILICFSTSLMLIIDSIVGFMQGLGFVEKISKIMVFQQIILIGVSAIILSSGGGLWSLGITNLLSVIILCSSLFYTDLIKVLKNLYNINKKAVISYKNEIFPFQWKIGLSWISGYFIFQLMNPVLFATEGPIIAGKMGMSLTALGGISSLSMSWITTKIPKLSGLVAQNKKVELNFLFDSTLKKLLYINLFLLLFFNIIIFIAQYYNVEASNRFLPVKFLSVLSMVTFINQLIFSWATYLRCHKQEPFLLNSIVGGVLCSFSTLFLGNYYGLEGVVYGYTFLTLFIGFPWAYFTYTYNKKLWN